MDQVKVVLAAIKKHHFWVLCGVIVLIVLGAWWSATSGLAKSIETRKGELESAQKSVKSVTSESLHANEKCISAIETQHEKLKNQVYDAWDFFYQEQKKNNKWPPVDPTFRRDITLLGPEDEISREHLDSYMYFIRRHLPRTFEIADLRLPLQRDAEGNPITDEDGNPVKVNPFEKRTGTPGYSGMGEYSGGMPEMTEGAYGRTASTRDELVGKVEWVMNDLNRIYGGYYWKTRPTTTQVRLAQEDLWVYEALLRIIAKTNESSTSHYNAAVKTIRSLQIGQKAAAAFAKSRSIRTTGMGSGDMYGGAAGDMYSGSGDDMYGAAGPDPMDAEMPAEMGAGMPGPGMGMGDYRMEGGDMYGSGGPGMPGGKTGSLEDRIKSQLMNFRYVDQNGMPLPADRAIDDPPFAEFKMMPVHMVLVVDQRRIANLLVNCANSPMPVVVCQVNLNPGQGGTLKLGGAGDMVGGAFGGPMGMMPGSGGEDMYDGGMDMGAGFGGGPTSRNRDQQITYDMPIEVQGIIYIFNPPDREKLGTGSAGEEPSMPPSGPPAIPPAGATGVPPAGAPTRPPGGAQAVPPTGPPAAAPTGPPGVPPTGAPGVPPTGAPAVPPTGAPAGPAAAPAAPTGPTPAAPTAPATAPAAGGENP